MSGPEHDTDEFRRQLAKELAPVTRELAASAEAAQTPSRRSYWRSIGDLVGAPSFQKWAHDEFPALEEELSIKTNGPSRRRFLQLMGASMALAGLGAAGCRRPETKIRPYNKKPVDVVIGKGMYYATTFVLGGAAMGVLAETHEGRPTKIEGNPLHPNSGGGTDLFAQASVLELFDPDRSRVYRNGKNSVSREQFAAAADALGKELKGGKGAGLAILLQETNSPAVEMILRQMGQEMPEARVYAYQPLRPDVYVPQAIYDFSQAKVIVSLDADIFGLEDEGVRYRRQFIDARRVDETGAMNQLFVIEPCISQTGAIADHRLALKASTVGEFASSLASAIRSGGDAHELLPQNARKWVEVVAKSLQAAGARGVVVAGERQGKAVHLLAHEINTLLGSMGKAVSYADRDGHGTLVELAKAVKSGQVKTLVIVGGNPAYDAPADLDFAALLKSVPTTIRLGLYDDETSEGCTWQVPAAHYLESWGDARASDGTISVIQPMIEPLFAGMTAIELLARLTAFGKTEPYELVRMSFKSVGGPKDETFFAYVQEGVFKGKPRLTQDVFFEKARLPEINDEIEICFAPDAKLHDGRFANNAWLQECPDPISKLTWDNAAIISLAMGTRLGLATGDMVKIEVSGRALEIPVFIMPGVADNSMTLPLGYGRSRGGVICKGAGFNTYALRTSDTMGFASGATVTKLNRTYKLATTQEHWSFDLDKHLPDTADEQAKERAIIREGTFEQFQEDPGFAKKMGEHAPVHLNIYTSPELSGANQWAMIVDLNACVGCNACVMACQAENNVPVVGKDEVIRGREMHWLRLDRYFVGDHPEEIRTALQPMMCQHCENAPCEPVCPVNATVHSLEGLNQMVYNRCIGTRYCSNNCPYKVRRFNFFDWNKGTMREQPEVLRDSQITPLPTAGWSRPQIFQPPMQEMLQMAKNPNVSVRIRGVMEKCTYCVQRIETAKIAARSATGQGAANGKDGEGNPAVRVPEGTVVSACAQCCPTKAIIFGDVADKNSDFYKKWSAGKSGSPRSYEVLEHLNVRPRTHYLAKIRHVNEGI